MTIEMLNEVLDISKLQIDCFHLLAEWQYDLFEKRMSVVNMLFFHGYHGNRTVVKYLTTNWKAVACKNGNIVSLKLFNTFLHFRP
jgi:hypothetical protein